MSSIDAQLAQLVAIIREFTGVRDLEKIRMFEIALLQTVDSLSRAVQELQLEKEVTSRRAESLKGHLERLMVENEECKEKYKSSRLMLNQMNEDLNKYRSDIMKLQAHAHSKQVENEQLKAQVAFFSSELREKQKELLLLAQLQERVMTNGNGVTNHGNSSNHVVGNGNSIAVSVSAAKEIVVLGGGGGAGAAGIQISTGASTNSIVPLVFTNTERRASFEANQGSKPSSPGSKPSSPKFKMLTRKSSHLLLEKELSLFWHEGCSHSYVLGPRVVISGDPFSKDKLFSVEELLTVDIDTFTCGDDDFLPLLEEMLVFARALELLRIDRLKLRCFLCAVQRGYRANPFHNFHHAFCVTQMMFYFLFGIGVLQILKEMDILLLLVSAICHDLDHPGLNNTFQVNSKSPVAAIFTEESVLESYHASCCFHILSTADTNIFSSLDPAQAKVYRKVIRECILATDMANHFGFLRELESLESIDMENSRSRQLVLNMLLKCADISNEVRPFQVCRRWAESLMSEFASQGELERQKGLPLTPMMEREALVLTKMQTGFISNMLKPALGGIARHIPQLAQCVDRVDENLRTWSTLEAEGRT